MRERESGQREDCMCCVLCVCVCWSNSQKRVKKEGWQTAPLFPRVSDAATSEPSQHSSHPGLGFPLRRPRHILMLHPCHSIDTVISLNTCSALPLKWRTCPPHYHSKCGYTAHYRLLCELVTRIITHYSSLWALQHSQGDLENFNGHDGVHAWWLTHSSHMLLTIILWIAWGVMHSCTTLVCTTVVTQWVCEGELGEIRQGWAGHLCILLGEV